MNLKTYSSDSLAGALAAVKKDLGPDAVVLHTRSYRRGGILGIGARTVVEVTAANGESVGRKRPAAKSPAAPRPVAAPKPSPMADQTAGDLIRKTYAIARSELQQRQAAATPAPVAPPPQPPAAAATDTAQLAREMQAVKAMIAQLMAQQKHAPALSPVPAGMKQGASDKLHDHYLGLLKQQVTDEIAEEVVREVRGTLTPVQIDDEALVRSAVLGAMARFIPVEDGTSRLNPTPDGRPRTIALIGPTGVGKTTTIAKLAATFKLKHKKKIGLVTLDTYRIAAVEQLRTYANIIGLPLYVAANPEELKAALLKCKGCDVVLIDTAGRSQRDDPRLEQLKALLDAADPHEVHLVLASTCSEPVLVETIDRFSQIRADRIIFTKLDEAVSFGVVVNVARRVNKRLSYVTTGQEVPHQIEPGRPERLAGLLLGEAL